MGKTYIKTIYIIKNKMPQLFLDTREHALIAGLEMSIKDVQICNLDVGDIAIKVGNDYAIVIERKTVADLVASICDGRYREQKQRLKTHQSNGTKIAYLIEGSVILDDYVELSTRASVPNSTVVSCIINLCLRDGFTVFNTNSVKETIAFIKALYKRYQQDPFKYEKSDANGSTYVPNIKTCKKDNNTVDNCFVMQLCAIPGISVKKADAIVKGMNVHNMRQFVQALTSPTCLEHVDGIGKQLANKIFTYISGDSSTIQ